jgi:arginyl-tRNA synthetase
MQTIPSILEQRLRAAVDAPGDTPLSVVPATDSRFGDYQSNAAMLLAKQRRMNPRAVAQEIVERLGVEDLCSAVEIAGAGFLNFRLRADWVQARVSSLREDSRLGVPAPARPQCLVIDFSSPNVAKPMHVGHIRSTILGDSLARIAEYIGHKVVRDNHIGDWGTQFGMLLLGWKTILDRAALDQDPLLEMERIYKTISAGCREDAAVLEKARHELVLLQAGDAENLALWNEMIRLSQFQFDAIYGRLGVRFDVTLGESFYNDRLKSVVEDLRKLRIAKESDGAICVFSDGSVPQEQDVFLIKDKEGWRDNPAIVLKSDGAANYTTTDLATLQYRIETWSPDEIVYVTDGRQQLHFRQMFTIFRRWNPERSASVKLSHVWFGSILGDDGKPFKTRSGETIRLADLLDEAQERSYAQVSERNPQLPEAERREIARVIGIGAVKYADLLPHRQGDYVFNWDRMLSFQGNTAPYLQNAYVRIRSIFRKLAEAGETWDSGAALLLEHPAELSLGKRLLEFGEVLPSVLQDHRPNTLANYLYELANTFHAFYEACPVLKAEGAQRQSRLGLCDLASRMVKTGLGLLGIEVPEKM